MTLAEFLLARIAEDESAVRAARDLTESDPVNFGQIGDRSASGDAVVRVYAMLSMGRLLAEYEAKRRIVESETEGGYWPLDHPALSQNVTVMRSQGSTLVELRDGTILDGQDAEQFLTEGLLPILDTPILRLLALPYADHPDFDEAWRP